MYNLPRSQGTLKELPLVWLLGFLFSFFHAPE